MSYSHNDALVPEPQPKRKTLVERAGAPASANFASSLPVSDPFKTTAPASYRNGSFASSTNSRTTSNTSGRQAHGSSISSNGRSVATKYGRPKTAMGHSRSTTQPSNIYRPGTSMGDNAGVKTQPQQNGMVKISDNISLRAIQCTKHVRAIRSLNNINFHVRSNHLITSACFPPKIVSTCQAFDSSANIPRNTSISTALQGLTLDESLTQMQGEPAVGVSLSVPSTPSHLPRKMKMLPPPFPSYTSPILSVKKNRSRSPMKEVFLNKDSNLRVAAFDPEERLRDFSSMWATKFEEFSSQMTKSMSEQKSLDEVVALLKAKSMYNGSSSRC